MRVNGQYSEEFGVEIGVQQVSVLSPVLFTLVLEALSREFCTSVLWELLYTDDLVLIADTQEECIFKLKALKAGMESKGLRVNMKKNKFLVSDNDQDVSRKYPCVVCCSYVGRNAILCSLCTLWVEQTCCGITKRLVEDPNYICPRCKGESWPIDGRTVTEVDADSTMFDMEATFCCLGDMLCSGGGCESAVAARCCVTWEKFRKILHVLTSRQLSPELRNQVYVTGVHSAMLHGSDTWRPKEPELQQFCRNDRAMICWICGIKDSGETSSASLLHKLDIDAITSVLRCWRLRWNGHGLRPVSNLSQTFRFSALERVEGPGRHGLNVWMTTDDNKCGLAGVDSFDRDARRAGVRHSLVLQTPEKGIRTAL